MNSQNKIYFPQHHDYCWKSHMALTLCYKNNFKIQMNMFATVTSKQLCNYSILLFFQRVDETKIKDGYKKIRKPRPDRSLKMKQRFILTADKVKATITPEV